MSLGLGAQHGRRSCASGTPPHGAAHVAAEAQKADEQPAEDTGMDYEDEELTNLAEAAVGPPADEGPDAGECHRREVAEAKCRISKVKKVAAKK